MPIKHTEKSQKAIDQLIEKFKAGDLGTITDGIKFQIPKEFPSHKYSMRNIMVAYGQADSVLLGGYNFWKDNGRYPTKDSGVYIFAPRIRKVEEEDGTVTRKLYGYRLISVYPIEKTEVNKNFKGEVLNAPDLEPAVLPPLTNIAEKLGIKIDWKPVPFDRWADYWKTGERINMGTDSPKVFFHELGHALHEAVDNKFNEKDSGFKEVVAEFTSAILMKLYLNEDSSGNAWNYIKQYAEDPTDAVSSALTMIQKMMEKLSELTEEEVISETVTA